MCVLCVCVCVCVSLFLLFPHVSCDMFFVSMLFLVVVCSMFSSMSMQTSQSDLK